MSKSIFKSCVRRAGRLLGVAVLTASFAMVPTAHAAFELDANAKDDGGGDWQSHTTAGPGQTGVISDTGGVSIFTTGGSKDDNDTTQWRHKPAGSSPPKNNITNAYAIAKTVGSDLVIYAGLDRFSVEGTANVGFWFFQGDINAQPNGTFGPGKHVNGDLLVVAEYTNGGRVGAINVFVWRNGGLVQVVNNNQADCLVTGGALPCGRTNAGFVTLYWPYSGKNGATTPPQAEAGAFVEVGVNVSKIARDANLPTPCFTSFLAETRTSATASATLKDFVIGSFPVCGVNISSVCPGGAVNAAQTGFTWSYNGTVTNTGFGTLFDVKVYDSGADQQLNTADDKIHNFATLTGTQQFQGTFDTIGGTPNPSINIARVEAATSPGGARTVTAEQEQPVSCPPVQISPQLSVTKNCDTTLDTMSYPALVAVGANVSGMVCNIGAIGLKNVSVINDNGTPNDVGDDSTLLTGISLAPAGAANGADCKPYSAHYTPSSVNAGTVPTSVPGNASFSDTVRANGVDVLTSKSATQTTATASCPLCK